MILNHNASRFFDMSLFLYNWTGSNLQVADFGLAKLSQDNVTHVSTRIMGTFG